MLSAAALLAATALAGCGGEQDWRGVQRTPAPNVSDTSLKAPKGEVLAVYFGYTSCPDICPTTSADLRLAIDQLPRRARGRVTPVFITTDPARDSQAKMDRYLANFFQKYRALRIENPTKLRQVEKAFGARHKKGKTDKTGNYPVDHTTFLYLVSDQGRIVSELPFGAPYKDVASDLKKALN